LNIDNWDIRNFSPRFGFSWDPVGDGKTSIRGGIGTYASNPTLNAGNVGTYGCSYMGGGQIGLVALMNPHLKAMIPQAAGGCFP